MEMLKLKISDQSECYDRSFQAWDAEPYSSLELDPRILSTL